MTSSTRNVTNFRGHQGSLQSIGRCRFRWLGRSVMNGTAAGNWTDRLTGKGGNLRKDRQVNTIRSSAAASKGGASVDTRHHHDDTDPKNQGNVVEEIHICRHCLSNKIVNLKSNCDSFWSMLGITRVLLMELLALVLFVNLIVFVWVASSLGFCKQFCPRWRKLHDTNKPFKEQLRVPEGAACPGSAESRFAFAIVVGRSVDVLKKEPIRIRHLRAESCKCLVIC